MRLKAGAVDRKTTNITIDGSKACLQSFRLTYCLAARIVYPYGLRPAGCCTRRIRSAGERDPWQTEGGGVTEDLLRALRIPFAYLDDPDRVARRIAKAQTLAYSANKPVALLLCRDLMWEEPS